MRRNDAVVCGAHAARALAHAVTGGGAAILAALLADARRRGAARVTVQHVQRDRRLEVTTEGGTCDAWGRSGTMAPDAPVVEGPRAGVRMSPAYEATLRVVVVRTPAGTTVTIDGLDAPRLASEAALLARGFSVPVAFNGVALRRSHALGAAPCTQTPVGAVRPAGVAHGVPTRATACYLQGLPVADADVLAPACNVVHLDPARFAWRAEAGGRLVDHEAALERVEAALAAWWQERLVAMKRASPPAAFVAAAWAAARVWGHAALFNDVPLLPAGLLERIVASPAYAVGDGAPFVTPFRRVLAEDEVAAGRLRLVALGPLEADTTALWVHARERNALVLRPGILDPGHWIHAHVREPDPSVSTVTVTAIEPSTTTRVRWHARDLRVRLCEAVAVEVDGDRVVVRDAAVYQADEDTLLVPEGEVTGQGMRQVAGADDVEGDEPAWQAAEAALAEAIAVARSPDPARAFARLLVAAQPERYPALCGRRFRVEVGEWPSAHRVVLETA